MVWFYTLSPTITSQKPTSFGTTTHSVILNVSINNVRFHLSLSVFFMYTSSSYGSSNGYMCTTRLENKWVLLCSHTYFLRWFLTSSSVMDFHFSFSYEDQWSYYYYYCRSSSFGMLFVWKLTERDRSSHSQSISEAVSQQVSKWRPCFSMIMMRWPFAVLVFVYLFISYHHCRCISRRMALAR